ncbi:phosphotransferase family protein [Ectobacillus ponti]|uniref:Phosphotransferase n=1 Tax=Ectobacillus ponti TaxID=2961894 RepID=A0AA41XDF7_9BACI|nr:phosphotransferase [Ectobacillus ponti]MCP8970853.1 phosphotransferase [Ectobacillus ponti]
MQTGWQQLLQAHYGGFTPVRLSGGYTNDMFYLEGTDPPLVAKISGAGSKDARNEVRCLQQLQDAPVPKLYAVWEEEDQLAAIMDYRQGQNGQSLLDSGSPDVSALYESLGRTLAAHVHRHDYRPESEIRTGTLPQTDLPFVPEDLAVQSEEWLKRLPRGLTALTHGDYGPHNVLYTPEGLTVLDWEWAEWNHPLFDLAWTCWFTKLHYPEQADEWNRRFLNAYLHVRPLPFSSEQLQSCCVYKVWQVLHKIQHAPQAQAEWVRRLRWTLDTRIAPC